MELGVELMSLAPSSKPPMPRRFDIKLGCGKEPGPLGEGKWRPDDEPDPMPGDGARRGGVARPKPESESDRFSARHQMEARVSKNQWIKSKKVKKGEDSKAENRANSTTNLNLSSPPLTASLLVSKINHFKPKTKRFLKLYWTRDISQTKRKKVDKKRFAFCSYRRTNSSTSWTCGHGNWHQRRRIWPPRKFEWGFGRVQFLEVLHEKRIAFDDEREKIL